MLLLASADTASAATRAEAPTPRVSSGIRASDLAASSDLWLPPLDGGLEVARPYDLPNGPYQAGHRGLDLPAAEGATIRSPTAGTVTFVGMVVDRAVLSVRIDDRTVVSLEPVVSSLRVGDAVARGQPLGVVASGGHCDASCLHLGVRVNDEYVNPMRYFRQRPILVPW
jgi:murein DD-endopeptidase MepM/ murein hydrolase activator NlpD